MLAHSGRGSASLQVGIGERYTLWESHWCNLSGMSRPRTVDPNGHTRVFGVMVAESVYQQLKKEAERRGISMGAVVREKLENAA